MSEHWQISVQSLPLPLLLHIRNKGKKSPHTITLVTSRKFNHAQCTSLQQPAPLPKPHFLTTIKVRAIPPLPLLKPLCTWLGAKSTLSRKSHVHHKSLHTLLGGVWYHQSHYPNQTLSLFYPNKHSEYYYKFTWKINIKNDISVFNDNANKMFGREWFWKRSVSKKLETYGVLVRIFREREPVRCEYKYWKRTIICI